MTRPRLAAWVGARAAGFALAFGVAAGLCAGARELIAQDYISHRYWRLVVLLFRGAAQDGLQVGFIFALLVFFSAAITVTITRRAGSGWIAALATLPVTMAGAIVLRAGFAARFATLFPAAYASAPGITPDTVFWIFLPPLARHILMSAPGGHWGDIAVLTGGIVAVSVLVGYLVALTLRFVHPTIRETKPRRAFAWFLPPLAALGVVALLLNAPANAARGPAHPDVILISIDTVRADALGCYSASPSPSPSLDAFARQADRYVRAYAPSPWTIPSHAGLLTGLANHHHGAQTMDSRLPPALLALAESFAQAGWETGAFVNSFLLSPRYGFGQGFGEYVMDPDSTGEGVVNQALAWFGARAKQPAFMFVHLFDPHWPYGPADEHLPGGAAKNFHEFVSAVLDADEPTRRAWRERYRDEIRRADHAVGRLFAAVQAAGRWNDAWVMVVSDHGEEWWDHGFLGHAVTLFDEVLRVPLLVKRPGQITAREFAGPVSLLDVPATLVEQLNLRRGILDGVNLARAGEEERSLLASSEIWGEPRFALIQDCGKGITSYQWRFGRFGGAHPDAVFDVCADRGETSNLAETESGLALLTRLWSQVRTTNRRGGVVAATPSPAVREKLRSLGYLE